MASLNFGRAKATLTNQRFYIDAALVVVGSLASSMGTDYIRQNVVDFDVPGGDAVYSLAVGAVALMVLPKRFGEPVALGCAASAVRIGAEEFGVLSA